MGLFARLAAAFRPPHVELGGTVLPQPPIWHQYDRIGGNLTPADVSAILRQADTGDCRRLVTLANECRQRDGHLHSVLTTRENALSRLPWAVLPHVEHGQDEPEAEDVEIAAFVTAALEDAEGDGQDCRNFDDCSAHLQGGVFHGHATAETAWKRDRGYLLPSGWRLHNQRRFLFRYGDQRLVWNDAYGTLQGVDLQADYPGQFVQHLPRVNGDMPSREGLSHLLIWPALFRNWSTADWMKLAELAWKPWRLGKLLKGAGERDRATLIAILEQLTTDGVAILSPGQEVDIRWANGSGGPGAGGGKGGNHQAICEFMGAEMSKATVGQTLTTEQGDKGARSLGDVHNEVRKDLRFGDAKASSSTVNRDIVRWIVWLNFGDRKLPKFVRITDESKDLGAFGKSLQELRKAGIRIPRKWAYKQAGVPQPSDGDDVLGEDVDLSGLEGAANDEGAAAKADGEPKNFATAMAAFNADLRELRQNNIKVTQDVVDTLAERHRVPRVALAS